MNTGFAVLDRSFKVETSDEFSADYLLAKLGTAAEEVTLCGAGEQAIGAVQAYQGADGDALDAGDPVRVRLLGETYLVAAAAVSKGDKVKAAASGQVTPATESQDVVVGIALEAASGSGKLFKALLVPGASAVGLTGKVTFGTNDWGVGATGVLLNGTDPDMVHQVCARINAAVASGAYAASYNQMAVTITQTNDVSTFASWNELYFSGTTATNGNNAAVWGHVEITGTFTGPGSTSTMLGAFIGSILTPATITNTGIMGAFVADSVMTSGFTNNGVLAAFVAHVNASHATKANWPFALYCDGVDYVFGFGSGTAYEDGVKVASITGIPDTTAAGVLRFKVGSTAYYIPFHAGGDITGE